MHQASCSSLALCDREVGGVVARAMCARVLCKARRRRPLGTAQCAPPAGKWVQEHVLGRALL